MEKAAKKKSPPAAQAKKTPTKRAPASRQGVARRADFGAPVEGFFARQPAHLRAILDELRAMIENAAPDAQPGLKWGMPWWTVGDTMMCALTAHKAHVNLILPGQTGTYADPDGLLIGESKNGRHLKLSSLDDLPRQSVRGWLRTAAELARGKK